MEFEEFEKKVMDLWMTTAIPMSRANIAYFTSAPRKSLTRWLDQMVGDGTLELDSDDDGALLWVVPGSPRPPGPRDFAELQQKRGLGGPLKGTAGEVLENDFVTSSAKSLMRRARQEVAASSEEGKKSLAWSGGLSLVLGPLGWLYAGAWKEAIPAAAGFAFLYWLLPSFLMLPVLFAALPVSALAGLAYAWKYNKHGERRPLLPQGSDEPPTP